MRAGLPGHPRSPRPLRRLRLRARNCRAGCAHWWRGRSARREHQFHRHAVGHLARQPGHRAAEGDHAPRRLRQPEGGGVGGDADVGAEQQLHAGREAGAVDGGNHRLVEGEVAQARRFLQRPVVQDAALPFIAGLAVPPPSRGSMEARSPPEQKAFGPLPVTTSTRTSSSRAQAMNASAGMHAIRGSVALRTSGRLRTIVAMPSACEKRTGGVTWPGRQ